MTGMRMLSRLMRMGGRRRATGPLWVSGLLALGLVAGCASTNTGQPSGSGKPVAGGTVTVAETAGIG
nr:hypothetical protein [Candidatus Dormibacteraeota bacterium]